jgi:hypothetical protein
MTVTLGMDKSVVVAADSGFLLPRLALRRNDKQSRKPLKDAATFFVDRRARGARATQSTSTG